MVAISLTSNPKNKAVINRLQKNFRDGIIEGFKMAMLYAESKSKASFGSTNAPKVRSGHLRRSIYSRVEYKSRMFTGYLFSDVKYSAIHEFGGIIKAKNSPYLRFKINESWVTKKQVIIPRRSYMEDPIIENLNTIQSIFNETLEKRLYS